MNLLPTVLLQLQIVRSDLALKRFAVFVKSGLVSLTSVQSLSARVVTTSSKVLAIVLVKTSVVLKGSINAVLAAWIQSLGARGAGVIKLSAWSWGQGKVSWWRDFDDNASDVSSTTSGYRSGRGSAKLFREPVSKSNRPIIMNAVEYVVFPGVVNKETRTRVLEEIERCECPHFLILFRDSKLQFRGLYAYYPDTEEVFKIYGVGPRQVGDSMMDGYYKYNSGGKKFTQIHTKHLTVTIDGFTIHNSLWLGKKTKLPDKKDMALVI